MSRAQIKRFGRRCFICRTRKRSVITRPEPHSTVTRQGKRLNWKRQTMLCDECAPKVAP